MNRRSFLLSLLAVPVAALVCPTPPKFFEVSFDFGEKVVHVDLVERYLRPAAQTLANQIDDDLVRRLMSDLQTHNLSLKA